MSAPVLSLQGFGVAYGPKVVLGPVDLELPPAGVTVLMGPGGGGKSTLLRTLAGLHEHQPQVRTWGQARYLGRELGPARPALAMQKMELFVSSTFENLAAALPDRASRTRAAQREAILALLDWAAVPELSAWLDRPVAELPLGLQRMLVVLRAFATGAPLVCLDETMARLEEAQASRVIELMRRYARERAVLFVTHHQRHAQRAADTCVLLAGGCIQEHAPTRVFFSSPAQETTRRFIETGSLALPSPSAPRDTLAETVAPPPPLPRHAEVALSSWSGPRGFRWLLPGLLAGTPRPGVVASLEDDLRALKRVGIATLVTLEESRTVPDAAAAAAGLELLHFPVKDMGVPSREAAGELCAALELRLGERQPVALHCLAGHGRTGTLLACQLIWRGADAVEALERTRGANPQWVTSAVQLAFLERFATHHADRAGPMAGVSPRPPARNPREH